MGRPNQLPPIKQIAQDSNGIGGVKPGRGMPGIVEVRGGKLEVGGDFDPHRGIRSGARFTIVTSGLKAGGACPAPTSLGGTPNVYMAVTAPETRAILYDAPAFKWRPQFYGHGPAPDVGVGHARPNPGCTGGLDETGGQTRARWRGYPPWPPAERCSMPLPHKYIVIVNKGFPDHDPSYADYARYIA